jgi:soluble lytic murein transglycosylase-like protein
MAETAKYDVLIGFYARRHSLPVWLLKALIRQESAFDPAAVSPRGAMGLCQLMPGTWAECVRELKKKYPDDEWSMTRMGADSMHLDGTWVEEPNDPENNIRCGAYYLAKMMRLAGKMANSLDNQYELALAAYNAGPGNVFRKYRAVPPFPETMQYVRNIMSHKPTKVEA